MEPSLQVSVKRPLVSVVLPTHNRKEFLSRSVASVLAQTEQNFELIVVDDASTDGTQTYLATLPSQDARIRVIRNSIAKGGGGARNEGIIHCRGLWVAFLDDDDEWMPGKLQRQLEVLDFSHSAVACSCGYEVRLPSGLSNVTIVPTNVSLRELFDDNWLGGASMCICSTTVLREIGGFDSRLRSAQDLDLWVRLRQRGNVVVCKEPLVLYRAHQGPRITNNMNAQYVGVRRFYFKYRHLMDASLRRRRVSHSCFIMSRQINRSLRCRMRYLILALRNSSIRVSWSYATSSLPRLARDAVLKRFI